VSTKGTTICLLDDDASVLKATSRMLSYAGYRVQSFTDPTTFLTYAFDHQPCVAVLDILMPAMNGLEVQRRLRHVSSSTRVIILSSKDDPIVRATAMCEGASDFFIKGIENKGFLAGIESALSKNGREAGGASQEVSSITAIQSAAADT
jgi:two-component system, OmpR family, response regulator MprA